MSPVRERFLAAAETAASLLAAPEVAGAWDEPSALAKLSVRGLAGHLAVQVHVMPRTLAEPIPTEPVISLHEYFTRASWIGSDVDDPANERTRAGGVQEARDGAAALAAGVADGVRDLRRTLLDTPNRPVRRSNWGPWSLSLDDFVTSRLLEIVVHADDLAHSVGIPTPEFPAQTVETVVDLLSRIALRRHGAVNVLRALSRAERAPASISAL
ncbi:maleylpyruvate isomerase N-terminal domain-containing protein [Actinophytocola sediminis]